MPHHYHQHQYTMRRWVKLENCQWVFKEENILEWLSKFGKPLTCWKKKPTNDEDNCQNAVVNGNLSAKMTIHKDIPRFLPIMGQKVQVYNR